jgi:hypothetical protein
MDSPVSSMRKAFVNQPVEDAVGDGADLFMPVSDWQLRSKDDRSPSVPVVADFEKVPALAIFQRSHGKIVQHEHISPGQFL